MRLVSTSHGENQDAKWNLQIYIGMGCPAAVRLVNI
jgi:hypothetical protein